MKRFYKVGLFFLFLSVFSIFLNGCATLFKGSTEGVNFSSEPKGAEVYVNGVLMGTTPLSIELKSNKSYTIQFKKDGFLTKSVVINNTIGAGWLILDVLGGLIPIIVDAATGNWYELDQNNVNAVLERQQK